MESNSARRPRKSPTADIARQRALSSAFRNGGGVITSGQLNELGFDRGAVARLVTAHRLSRVHNGVYRNGTIPDSVETNCRAALAAMPPTAALGLESSAFRHGMLMYAPSTPQIVVPARKRLHDRASFDIHRFPDLAARDVVVIDGLRCTGPARTVLDLAGAVRSERQWRALRRATKQAVKLDRTVADHLRNRLDRDSPFQGSALLRALLDADLLGTLTVRSTLEEDFLDFCAARGIPLPETNVMLEGVEVDALWRLQRVVVELDTWDYHGNELSFEADRERDEYLRERGWPVSRITGRRLAREPDRVEAQLRRRLGLLV